MRYQALQVLVRTGSDRRPGGLDAQARDAGDVIGSVALTGSPTQAVICDGRFQEVRHPAAADADLRDVQSLSRADAWAVGVRFDPEGPSTTLTEHRNGTRWRVVPSPNPGRTNTVNVLNDVSGMGSDDVWAVGIRVPVSSSTSP